LKDGEITMIGKKRLLIFAGVFLFVGLASYARAQERKSKTPKGNLSEPLVYDRLKGAW